MGMVPSYPQPRRDLADQDLVLGDVDGKTVAIPIEAIVKAASAAGTGGGGGSGASGEWAA
jgi:hypothetical protein